jgi:GTP-binding protein
VREEVRAWNEEMLGRPQLVAATKRDARAEVDPLPALREEARRLGLEVLPVSAATGEGLLDLRRALAARVAQARAEPVPVAEGERP